MKNENETRKITLQSDVWCCAYGNCEVKITKISLLGAFASALLF